MLRLEGVSRVYRVGETTVQALREITAEIPAGAHLAVMGPSGSGKSTLLHILGCLDRPTKGRYFFEEVAVDTLDERGLTALRRRAIGFVFQAYHLVARLTARENVELPLLFAGVERRERRRRALEALAAVGLEDRARHRPHQLSGGEQQRVAIARAAVTRPRVLLADEPTGNLDSAAGAQVLQVLEGLNREGITLVVVTHDPAVACRAERVWLLRDGRLVEERAGKDLAL